MAIAVKNAEEFERLIDGLGADLVSASIHVQLHQDLLASVADFEREFNQARTFWHLT